MNQRIQELVKQATRVDVTVDRFGGTEYTPVFDKEKFAELIIRECAHIANENVKLGSPYCGQFVRRHFGVEE